jgi:heat shock 70kDa protein 1/2/6/8
LSGDTALHQAAMNPKNTIFDVKRLIGRKFTDTTVQADMKHWPFKVVEGEKNTPMIEVEYKGETKQFRAEEISAMILTKMKSIAEDYLGKKVKNAVITVPAYFNDSQRQSTIDAGKIAGLNVIRIISEPIAAALAYGLHLKKAPKKNILVFDLGGGTFDVSILNIKNGDIQVKATNGDTHLGGEDFDNCIVDHFVGEIRTKYHMDITDNPRSLRRLRTACERAKRLLSSSPQVPIALDSLYNGIDFNSVLTRARFENMCHDYFKKCMEVCNRAMLDSKLGIDDIDDIVLVGGSTRIPKIRSMLADMFKGKELCQSINPDEAVAYGATVQSTMLSNVNKSDIGLVLHDVTPLSLGIELDNGLMSPIIPRNSTIPIKTTQRYILANGKEAEVHINVFEGERSMAKDNKLLGQFRLVDVQPLPKGTNKKVDVTFNIDSNGILTVSAENTTAGNKEMIVITYDTERLNNDEVERMISDAKRYQVEDEIAKKRTEAKLGLENYCFDLTTKLKSNEVRRKISARNMDILEAAIGVALNFNETNPLAEEHEYMVTQNELEDIARLVFDSYKKVDIPVVEGKPLIGIVGNALWKLTVGVIVPVVVGAISS